MKEIWKDVKEYEGLYKVSNLGNIKALKKIQVFPNGGIVIREEKLLKPNKVKNGYLNVRLYNGEQKGYGIHRLVARAFIPNPNNLSQINHINGNKNDNRVENLEWCNASYNQNHALKTGLKKVHKVKQYDLKGNYIKTWNSTGEITNYYNVSHVSIIDCCNGKSKKAHNYMWQYEEV